MELWLDFVFSCSTISGMETRRLKEEEQVTWLPPTQKSSRLPEYKRFSRMGQFFSGCVSGKGSTARQESRETRKEGKSLLQREMERRMRLSLSRLGNSPHPGSLRQQLPVVTEKKEPEVREGQRAGHPEFGLIRVYAPVPDSWELVILECSSQDIVPVKVSLSNGIVVSISIRKVDHFGYFYTDPSKGMRRATVRFRTW